MDVNHADEISAVCLTAARFNKKIFVLREDEPAQSCRTV